MKEVFKKLISICENKKSVPFLYFISFCESIFFPAPTDLFLVTFVLAQKKRFLNFVFFTTFFSVLGGAVTYLIGLYLWDEYSNFFYEWIPKLSNMIDDFDDKYKTLGILLVVFGGFSPFPYKITCISAGIIGISFPLFIVSSIISRGFRFFLVSYIFYKFNNKAKELINKYINLISCLIILVIIIFFFLI